MSMSIQLARRQAARTSHQLLTSLRSSQPSCRSSFQRRHQSTSSASAAPENHDIVVLGGGPAGLVLGAALASSATIASSHRITLLEGSNLAGTVGSWNPQPGKDWSNRVSSITEKNREWLEKIGVWEEVEKSRTCPVEEMQVWDGISSARIDFSSPSSSPFLTSSSDSRKPMATMVENLNLQRAALRVIEKHKTAGSVAGGKKLEILDGRKVLGIEGGESGWPVISLSGSSYGASSSEKKIQARLLIGADGFNSPVKAYSQMESFGWAYNNHALVATLNLSSSSIHPSDYNTAYQRFLPEGPIAFLPLSPDSASLVWTTTPALAALFKTLPTELLPFLINSAFTLPHDSLLALYSFLSSHNSPSTLTTSDLLAALPPSPSFDPSTPPLPPPPEVISLLPKSLASFPLKMSHSSSYLGEPRDALDLRTVLVGDAAHTCHPLAGQGLNMGLADCESLVNVLEEVVQRGGDVGAYLSLLPYSRARYIPNHLILSATDHLSSLYSSTSPPIVWARSTGLEVINELDFVKSRLMNQAGAVEGDMSGYRKKREAGVWGIVAGAVEEGLKVRRGLEGLVGLARGAVSNALSR